MYSTMSESELEDFIIRKIEQGFIEPDFLTCMFIDGNYATIYDALEASGQRIMKFEINNNNNNLLSVIKWFRDFDCEGYLIASPEMKHETEEALKTIEGIAEVLN